MSSAIPERHPLCFVVNKPIHLDSLEDFLQCLNAQCQFAFDNFECINYAEGIEIYPFRQGKYVLMSDKAALLFFSIDANNLTGLCFLSGEPIAQEIAKHSCSLLFPGSVDLISAFSDITLKHLPPREVGNRVSAIRGELRSLADGTGLLLSRGLQSDSCRLASEIALAWPELHYKTLVGGNVVSIKDRYFVLDAIEHIATGGVPAVVLEKTLDSGAHQLARTDNPYLQLLKSHSLGEGRTLAEVLQAEDVASLSVLGGAKLPIPALPTAVFTPVNSGYLILIDDTEVFYRTALTLDEIKTQWPSLLTIWGLFLYHKFRFVSSKLLK